MIIAVLKVKHEKKPHDLQDTGAVFYQLSYQAKLFVVLAVLIFTVNCYVFGRY